MRANIVIDDKLMKAALRATGLKTKRELVELGLRTLLHLRQQEEIRQFRGKLAWHGDLDIATRCIEDGYALLHDDRDFEPFVTHLGLRSVLST